MLQEVIVCTDATNISVNGVQQFIRNFSTDRSVIYTGMDKKNKTKLAETMLSRYFGTLVHDHETVMYRFGTEHAECNVHILRYLTKNGEDTGHAWSGKLGTWFCNANDARKARIAEGGTCFSEEELADMNAQFTAILAEGREENKKTNLQWARKKEQALLNRLEKYRENHLLFLRRFDVPFENNMSERDLRKVKNRQKVAGGFRDQSGRDMFCHILSFIETCKRRGRAVF